MAFVVGDYLECFCNGCRRSTWHTVLHALSQHYGDENGYEEWTDYTLRCEGCRIVKLRNDWAGSGMGDEVATTYYPPASLRREPEWVSRWWGTPGLKDPVRQICQEVYKALQNGMPHLAAMGVRSALEQVMIDKIGGDQDRFDKNLDELYKQGHVSLLMRERLQSVLDAGSATIHRGHTPTKADLDILVTVMEHVIESLYVHEHEVKRMAARTPKRPRKLRVSPPVTPSKDKPQKAA